jgi:hypothetical protein
MAGRMGCFPIFRNRVAVRQSGTTGSLRMADMSQMRRHGVIVASGVWIAGYTIVSGSPLVWTLVGILSITLGLISLIRQSVK